MVFWKVQSDTTKATDCIIWLYDLFRTHMHIHLDALQIVSVPFKNWDLFCFATENKSATFKLSNQQEWVLGVASDWMAANPTI